VEAVAGDAAGGAVEDLAATGVEVFLGYTGHGAKVKRTFILDKFGSTADSGDDAKTNDPSL
jgi:hypothetical protein